MKDANLKERVKSVGSKVEKVKKIKMVDEFRAFIARGNVLDLAVGVIIGSAFSNIVTAFTSILTDLLGAILGGINFKGLSFITSPCIHYTI